ncbi:unnamed protein product, partial [Brassica oleracea var. botrytis]
KISFKAWAKFSCALVVSVKQISGPLLLYDDRDESNRWWFSSLTKYRIDCCSPPRRRRIKSSVALLIDEESNHRWLLSRRKHSYVAAPQIERNRDGVIEEHDLQVKRLEDKITQLIRLVLLLPQALPLAMDQERRGRFVINKDEKSNTGNTFVFG